MAKRISVLCILAVLVCISFLAGCADHPAAQQQQKMEKVVHVGQVPDALQAVVQKNLFYDVTAFDGRLLKTEICSEDEENKTVLHQVKMMDVYGKELAVYTCSSDDAYHISTLTATQDGGFLFVLGFRDYAYDQNVWASDKGFASRVIKCDASGKVQFDTPFEGVDSEALCYCVEKNGQFYLFGTLETPDTKTRGVYSPTDIYMAILDMNGNLVKSRCIAGSDYDSLKTADIYGKQFVLSIWSQSDDGDFAGSDSGGHPVDWVIEVNDQLEIIEKKRESGREFSDDKLGVKDGAPVYMSDALFDDFDAGRPEAIIDYDSFYLVVSENTTGIYENMPIAVSSLWCYTETVYSAYDDRGNLIFRSSVDSSPDYDAWTAKFAEKGQLYAE